MSLEGIGVVPAGDEDSFKTPLNHADIYDLFLVNELAGQQLHPLTEWALNWIGELAKENAEPALGETPGASTDFIADIQSWITDHIKTAQERGCDSFAFALSADASGKDSTGDLLDVPDYTSDIDPLNTTSYTDQQVADTPQDTVLANQTVYSSWITADDFIA